VTLEEDIIEKLKGIIDPHTNTSIYDMGLISNLKVEGENVSLTFTPSSPYCPLGMQLALAVKNAVKDAGVKNVDVNVTGFVGEKELNEKLKTM
jgi:metal-sulfur cluster biosynthetic enzyme